MNVSRIFVIATNVFWEVIRDRVLYLIGLFALFMLAASQLLPQVAASTENKMLLDVGMAAISVIGLVVAIFVGTGLVNKEIEKRTVLVLLSKPISRVEFIVGKHLGLTGVLAVLVAAMTAIYFLLLIVLKVPYPIGSLTISLSYLFLELSLLTAVAILFGVATSSLLATLLTFAIFLMGHLSPDLVALGKLSKNPGLQRATDAMYLILPDLSRLDLKNQAVYGILPDPFTLLGSFSYSILYIVILLTIAVMIFARREF